MKDFMSSSSSSSVMFAGRTAATAAAAVAAGTGALYVICKLARRSPDFGGNWSLRSIMSSLLSPFSLKAQLVGVDMKVLEYLTDHSIGDVSSMEYAKIRQVRETREGKDGRSGSLCVL